MRKIYSVVLFSLFTFFLQAQELVIKGNVTVQPNAQIFVEGNVEISNGASLDIQSSGANRGKVEVNADSGGYTVGTWTCNGTTTSTGGEGEVYLLGASDYNLQGTSLSFPNLIADVEELVGTQNLAQINVIDSIHIARTLDLKNGKFVTSANKVVYVSNSDPNAIKSTDGGFGDQYSNYVLGTLRREVAVGATNFYKFPVGTTPFPNASPALNKKGYNPAFIDLRTSINARKPANVTSIAAKFVEEPNPGVINHHQLAHTCYSTSTQYQFLELHWMVKEFGYWDMKPNGNPLGWWYNFYAKPDIGYIMERNPGLNHMKVIKAPKTFTVNSSADWSPYVEESGNGCDMVNIYLDNMYWKPGPNTSNYPYDPTDSIRASELYSFSRFGLSGGIGAGLPIELLWLKATPVDNRFIKVDWVTATETENSGFDVERSTDGVNFTKIDFIPGNGTVSEQKYYYKDDHNVVANQLYYYRLKQIDYNGDFSYTYVVSAMITAGNTFVIGEFIPNPTQENSHIIVSTTVEKDLNLIVYNTLGQVMFSGDQHVVPGENKIDFNFNLLADGTYYAIFHSDNEVFNRKLILTK